jgi:hypothetical protein
VFGIVGVIVGGLGTLLVQLLVARGQRKREVGAKALMCLARLEKISRAKQEGEAETEEKEIHLLGEDLDRYVAATAAVDSRKQRERHWELCQAMIPMIIGSDFSELNNVIQKLTDIRADLQRGVD